MVLDRILDAVLPPPAYKFPPYDRLKPRQIRILSLQKNRHGPQISGNLKTINLADHVRTQDHPAGGEPREAPPYHAVSYAAGDLNKKVRFQCDGRIFFIGFNLWQALLRLADLDLPCPVWVDAICINQRDRKEKTRQIQQMAEVYRQAQRVWIWLGEAHHCTLPAITEMQRMVRVLSSNGTSSAFRRDYDHYFDELDRPREKWIVWEGIADLVHRPYFGRLWVLQEAILARKRTFLCGPHPFRWDDFQQLAYHLKRQRLRSFIRSFRSGPDLDAFDFFSDVDACDLSVLSSYKNLGELRDILMSRPCAGSSDKVMAVLGLLSAEQKRHVKADAPLPKLYANFTLLVLLRDVTLETFKLAGIHRGYANLPTWCPDYNVEQSVEPLSEISNFKAPRKFSKTAESLPITLRSQKIWFQMEITGYRLDTIGHVAYGGWPRRILDKEVMEAKEAKVALEWTLDCFDLLKDLDWGKAKYRRIYARTLIGNVRVVKEPRMQHISELFGLPRKDQISTDAYDHWTIFKGILQHMSDRKKDEGTAIVEGATRYMADLSRMCIGRAFFRTKQQRIGLGPRELRRNDIICFLGSAAFPFILRPNRPSRRSGHRPVYHLIGEVYIEDFMASHALGANLEKHRPLSFIIE